MRNVSHKLRVKHYLVDAEDISSSDSDPVECHSEKSLNRCYSDLHAKSLCNQPIKIWEH